MGQVAVIGAGPAGLIAAEYLAKRGHNVAVYDQMPSPGRKFLLAGRGGLNLTHSEDAAHFMARYGTAASWLQTGFDIFSPQDLRTWCEGLGQAVFVGSSGRVFPTTFKAAPLLRAWLRRLDDLGVRFLPKHQWRGFSGERALCFETPGGGLIVRPDATLLALGGASWPRMGSDGYWVPILRQQGVLVADLRASNSGARIAWSPVFASRFAGQPLKRVAITLGQRKIRGEAMITREGIEGGVIYALSAQIRDLLVTTNLVTLLVDLLPDSTVEALSVKLDGPRQGRSLGNFLRQAAGLSPAAIGLVREAMLGGYADIPLSRLVKALPLPVTAMQPIGRAISTAGGIMRESVNDVLMLRSLPGVFAAGEMLDWEAPTGGYLLQACFSTGVWSANSMSCWLENRKKAVLL